MGSLSAKLLLLAADAQKAPGPGGAAPDGGGGSFLVTFAPLLIILGIFYVLILLPQRREKQKQAETLKALKKNDKVVTIGGVVGTIVNIEPDSRVVTLRVDDNTRMVFLRSAIQGPYADPKEEPSSKEASS